MTSDVIRAATTNHQGAASASKNIFMMTAVSVTDNTVDGQQLTAVKPVESKEAPPVESNIEEKQYLDLITRILKHGEPRQDRTGTGTVSLFAPPQLRFSLDGQFPLLTTKNTFFRGLAEELFWFIHGCTDAKLLQAKGIKIWDGNASREFLDSLGFESREVGDLGPVYGFQWRHFGAEYRDCHADYAGQGVDQLAQVIDKIMNKPQDRRIIMSAWNPADLGKMALPPCHMFCQFYVSNPDRLGGQEPKLSCQLYQRSADVGLGVPFNIASYALLTCLIAHVCDIGVGEFVHVMGDAHIYKDHTEALQVQCERTPRQFPTLKINNVPRGGGLDALLKIKYEDLTIEGYNPYPRIQMKMSV